MDRGAWCAAVHGVAKSWARRKEAGHTSHDTSHLWKAYFSPFMKDCTKKEAGSPSNIPQANVESRSAVSDSLRPLGLYSPWNFPGQNNGRVAFSFSRESSRLRGWTQVSRIAGEFFTNWAEAFPISVEDMLILFACLLKLSFLGY